MGKAFCQKHHIAYEAEAGCADCAPFIEISPRKALDLSDEIEDLLARYSNSLGVPPEVLEGSQDLRLLLDYNNQLDRIMREYQAGRVSRYSLIREAFPVQKMPDGANLIYEKEPDSND